MINVKNVTKRYNKLVANDNVSLEVNPGETAIILGPNGAGKSTIIKSICGLLKFFGDITIGGYPNKTLEAKRILGYIPEFPALYPMLTVYEHLEFIAKAYRLENWETRAEELLTRFELDDKKNKLGKELSKGMQQKVSVCCALLPEPKAVIFDEPLVGLDPHAIRELKKLMVDLAQSGTALLISTHMIDSVEQTWDVCYIMDKGVVKQCVRRTEMGDKKLEDIYFEITEATADTDGVDSKHQMTEEKSITKKTEAEKSENKADE
ncbi:MAG: ABC transporter ATP-binding protein [Ruminococcus sp.]|jgi:ABC-type multidrug transport system ATPase subunit|nr:ABC transporter ATP-binding protein [Ruminococcus sp.]